jgi:hypothetical protein
MAPEFDREVCVNQIVNWDGLQRMLKQQPKLNLVEEIAFAAGGMLMEVAEERSFSLPWRIDAIKTTDKPIYSLELTGTLALLHPEVLLDVEGHFTLPVTIVLTDSEGRNAKITVKPVESSERIM